MTETTHLSTEHLTELLAQLLDDTYLDILDPQLPKVTAAEATGDTIAVTITYFGPLEEGAQRHAEHREIRVSPVQLPDPEPAVADVVADEPVDEPAESEPKPAAVA